MTYPVYIGDRAAGTMTVTAAGQDTVFELRCPDPEPGLWRAWVQGEKGRLDLGLLGSGSLPSLQNRYTLSAMKPATHLGTSPIRTDAPAKVRGSLRYTDDTVRAGTLQAAVLFSPLAHAEIKKIDTAAAAAAPGVRGVFTAPDGFRPVFVHRHRSRGLKLGVSLLALAGVAAYAAWAFRSAMSRRA